MPPSVRRGARGLKRDAATSDDTPNTSPTRPNKRKRAGEKKEEIEEKFEAELPINQAGIDMSEQEIIDIVSQSLLVPDHEVQLRNDHNNKRANKGTEEAYAKVTGRDWTFYVKRLNVQIGRPPEAYYPSGDGASTPAQSNEGSGLPAEPTEPSRIHMDLGPSKVVSRLHAEIFHNGESEYPGWWIIINGRNAGKLDGRLLTRGQSARLRHGSVIEIAGVEMLFVLPAGDEKLVIHPAYLRRSGLIRNEFPNQADQDEYDASRGRPGSNLPSQPRLPGHPPIAPAPPDYTRPDTPSNNKRRAAPSSTPRGSALTFVDSEHADYSLDENQHMKPTFTYSQLITQAILSTGQNKATLASIYEYVRDKYAFYRRPGTEKGWQNSIRHNLSLNAGFDLEPRQTHEPGKGGYWTFTNDKREELIAEAWGKTRKSPNKKSSSPNSPDSKPRRTTHGPGDADGGSPVRKMKSSPPENDTPDLKKYANRKPQFTPDQGRFDSSMQDDPVGDGSPLPRRNRNSTNVYGFSDNIQGSPPVLSSSYAMDEGNSLITPAPQRKRPYLAPPSTAQRPSQHMPTSSPAPFWRYADLGAATPMRPFDMSPIKGGPSMLQSSSPPRPDANGSPSRTNGEAKTEIPSLDQDEEPAFDLSKRFTSISSFHATNNNNQFPIASANGRA